MARRRKTRPGPGAAPARGPILPRDLPPRTPVGRALAYAWASPATALGLTAGALTVLTGGRAQRRLGTLEFHGGFSRWFLTRRSVGAAAMTLGHVVIGRDAECLDSCRDHEQIHVRQAERWGPAFIPLYLLASVWAWALGRHYYYDNPFEVDARRGCGEEI